MDKPVQATEDAGSMAFRPTLEAAEEFIRKAIQRRETLILVGEMEMEYKGRASSTTGRDERILIVKRDGAVLIHGGSGYRPINWQPDTSNIRIKNSGEYLDIEFIRRRPREILLTRIYRIFLLYSKKIIDRNDLEMYFTEEHLRKILKKMPWEIEEGLRIIGEEVEIPPGKVDLLGRDRNGSLVVIELKKGKVGRNEVLQLERYARYYRNGNPRARAIIVGQSITPEAEIIAKNLGIEFKQLDVRKLYKKL